MPPVRSPSPFETSDPGDALLGSTASINLEGSAHASIPGPSITSKPPRGEFILLKTEHMCPVEPNGGKARCRTSLAGFLKGLAKAGVRVFLPGDDSNSVDSKEAELGTLSIILSTKKAAMFDDALAGLESLSKSVYVRAFIDPEDGDESLSPDDVIRRVEKAGLLSWDCEGGDVGDEAVHDHVDTGGRSLASGFVLINVHNDLGGEGQGFLQMQELDDNDHNGDIDVCYSGTGF